MCWGRSNGNRWCSMRTRNTAWNLSRLILPLSQRRAASERSVWRANKMLPGPALVEAVVDANEPPMPGKVKTEQALHFAEALARGQKNAGKIVATVLKNQVREIV